jgi:opacity protein-like surface antigen
MLKLVRSRSLYAALVCLLAATGAKAQSSSNPTLDRNLARIDFALSAPLEFTRTTSGVTSSSDVTSQAVTTASGYLLALRYTKSPLLGAEVNYKYSRFTQNYTYAPTLGTLHTLGIEANATELTFGYVAHAPAIYLGGFKPYAAAGLGTTRFKPTPNGGQGVLEQYRATYYWNLGTDYTILGSHFGARVQLRQLFYKAPDFGENYLTSGAHTSTFEPSFGFFARF